MALSMLAGDNYGDSEPKAAQNDGVFVQIRHLRHG